MAPTAVDPERGLDPTPAGGTGVDPPRGDDVKLADPRLVHGEVADTEPRVGERSDPDLVVDEAADPAVGCGAKLAGPAVAGGVKADVGQGADLKGQGADPRAEQLAQDCKETVVSDDGELVSRSGGLNLFKASGLSSILSGFLNYKLPRLDDLTSFSGDNPPPCSHDFSEFFESEYGLRIFLIAVTAGLGGDIAAKSIWAPFRKLLPRYQQMSMIANDVKVLKRLFVGINRNMEDLEATTTLRFNECLSGIKNLSLTNEGSLQQILKAVEDAQLKDDAATKLAFEKLSAQLKRLEKNEISPYLNYLDEILKTAEIPIMFRKRIEAMRTELLTAKAFISKISIFLNGYFLIDAVKKSPEEMVGVDDEGEKQEPAAALKDKKQELAAEFKDTEAVVECFSSKRYEERTSCLYKDIGRKAKRLLHKRFEADSVAKMRLNLISRPKATLSLRTSTKPEVELRSSFVDVLGNRLKTVFSCSEPTFEAKVQYEMPYAGVSSGVKWGMNRDIPQLKLAVSTSGPIQVGCKLMFESRELKQWEVGAGGSYLGRSAAVKLLKGGILKASFLDQITGSTASALEAKYTHANENVQVSAGVEHSLSENTKLKIRVDSSGSGSASVEHSPTRCSFVSLATKFNLKRQADKFPEIGFCFELRPSVSLPGSSGCAREHAGVYVNSRCEMQGGPAAGKEPSVPAPAPLVPVPAPSAPVPAPPVLVPASGNLPLVPGSDPAGK